jgi:MFS-type transporter involved in bile tolerance (Atg22 family)
MTALLSQVLGSLVRLDNIRKFAFFSMIMAEATLLAYVNLLSGEQWVAAAITMATLFVGGNVMEWKAKGSANETKPVA